VDGYLSIVRGRVEADGVYSFGVWQRQGTNEGETGGVVWREEGVVS